MQPIRTFPNLLAAQKFAKYLKGNIEYINYTTWQGKPCYMIKLNGMFYKSQSQYKGVFYD